MSDILGPKVGYTDLLDLVITESLTEKETKERAGDFQYNPLRPSAAGYCARRLTYALNEFRGHAYYEKPLQTPPQFRLLELGSSVEFSALKNFRLLKVFQVRYKQQTLSFFDIVRGKEELKKELLEGSCDFVMWSEKHKAIGDVKSKKDAFSAAYKTRWDEDIAQFAAMASLEQLSETAFWADDLEAFIEELGDDFLVDNLYQLNLYANSQFMKQRGVDHAFIYRYNKNDSRHLEIRFRPSEKVAKQIEDKFNAISKAVDNQDLDSIDRDFVFGSIRCAFCPYSKTCWGDEDALRAFFNSLPKKSWPTNITPEDPLDDMFKQLEGYIVVEKRAEELRMLILKEIADRKLKKVRLANGNVYETKFLKSPQPHVELRRSKP